MSYQKANIHVENGKEWGKKSEVSSSAFCTFHLPASQVSLEKFGTSFAFEAGPCSGGIWPQPKDGHPPDPHLKSKHRVIYFSWANSSSK